MGKEITTKMSSHTAKEYWGGDDRGVCLQVTASGPLRVRETAEKQIQEDWRMVCLRTSGIVGGMKCEH